MRVTNQNSTSFEQMCNVVAVSQLQSTEEALQRLLLHCLVWWKEPIADANELKAVVDSFCNIDFTAAEIATGLEELENREAIKLHDGTITVGLAERSEVETHIRESHELEECVKDDWQKEVEDETLLLDFPTLWQALRDYLAIVFRQHGLQTVAVLAPDQATGTNGDEPLSQRLDTVVYGLWPGITRFCACKPNSKFAIF